MLGAFAVQGCWPWRYAALRASGPPPPPYHGGLLQRLGQHADSAPSLPPSQIRFRTHLLAAAAAMFASLLVTLVAWQAPGGAAPSLVDAGAQLVVLVLAPSALVVCWELEARSCFAEVAAGKDKAA
jgi:hypothetical protein